MAVISIDLSKVFDTIPHGLLLAKLKAYGVISSSFMLLKDYLHGRMQRVKVGDTSSDWQEVRRGCRSTSRRAVFLVQCFLVFS